jgi:hypothetical protein
VQRKSKASTLPVSQVFSGIRRQCGNDLQFEAAIEPILVCECQPLPRFHVFRVDMGTQLRQLHKASIVQAVRRQHGAWRAHTKQSTSSSMKRLNDGYPCLTRLISNRHRCQVEPSINDLTVFVEGTVNGSRHPQDQCRSSTRPWTDCGTSAMR